MRFSLCCNAIVVGILLDIQVDPWKKQWGTIHTFTNPEVLVQTMQQLHRHPVKQILTDQEIQPSLQCHCYSTYKWDGGEPLEEIMGHDPYIHKS
jgi:hypothetical protein